MSISEVILTISSPELDGEATALVTRRFAKSLANEAGIRPIPSQAPAEVDAKGDPITLGTLLLTALSSGSVVALFNIAKSYVERRRSLVFVLTRSDGAKMEVRAENLEVGQLDPLLRDAKRFFGMAEP